MYAVVASYLYDFFSLHLQHSGGYLDDVGICPNGGAPTSMESPHSVLPPTETPPPGYMSEDGDPIDPNDNMSEFVSRETAIFIVMFTLLLRHVAAQPSGWRPAGAVLRTGLLVQH